MNTYLLGAIIVLTLLALGYGGSIFIKLLPLFKVLGG